METAEIREFISAFVPEEILRNFELRKIKKELSKIHSKQFPEIEEAYKYCLRIRKWYEPIRPRYSGRKYKIKEADLMLITWVGMSPRWRGYAASHTSSAPVPLLSSAACTARNTAPRQDLCQNLQRCVSVNYGAGNTDFFLYRVALHFS